MVIRRRLKRNNCKFNLPEKKCPCVDCDVMSHDRYEPKQEQPKKTNDEQKSLKICKSCAFRSISGYFAPCKDCFYYDNKISANGKSWRYIKDMLEVVKDEDEL